MACTKPRWVPESAFTREIKSIKQMTVKFKPTYRGRSRVMSLFNAQVVEGSLWGDAIGTVSHGVEHRVRVTVGEYCA